MKKFLSILAVFTTINAYSQSFNNDCQQRYFNNITWTLIFKNLSFNTPIESVSHGLNTKGKNDIFINYNLNTNDIFTKKDLVPNEIINSLNYSFLNSIANDTTVEIKAICKKRLLFTLNFLKNDSNIYIDFHQAKKRKSEKVVYNSQCELISIKRAEREKTIAINNQVKSDSEHTQITNISNKYYTLLK